MPSKDDRTPGLANALFGPRLGRPVFVAARTSTPLPMSVTDPATNSLQDWRSRRLAGFRPQHRERYSQQMAARGPPNCGGPAPRPAPLLDLGFLKGHVLAGDRIIFLEGKLLGRRARVLLGHVEEAGSRRTQ